MKLPEDQPLSNALHQWKISAPPPPRLRESVWRKIALAEAPPPTAMGAWWKTWLAGIFARPALAAGYVAVLLAVGVTAGYFKGEARQQRTNDELAARYMQSLDPFLRNVQ
jgi:hypothetical protein